MKRTQKVGLINKKFIGKEFGIAPDSFLLISFCPVLILRYTKKRVMYGRTEQRLVYQAYTA